MKIPYMKYMNYSEAMTIDQLSGLIGQVLSVNGCDTFLSIV